MNIFTIFTDFITQLTTKPPKYIEHKWLKAMILKYNKGNILAPLKTSVEGTYLQNAAKDI